jgi:hypothetical protein
LTPCFSSEVEIQIIIPLWPFLRFPIFNYGDEPLSDEEREKILEDLKNDPEVQKIKEKNLEEKKRIQQQNQDK